MARNSEKPALSNQIRFGGLGGSTPSVASEGKSQVVHTSKGTGKFKVPTAIALKGKRKTLTTSL